MTHFDQDEDAIGRVLTGLQSAEPKAGLEQRVKLAIERRESENSASRRRSVRHWQIPAFAMLGVVAAVIVILGFMLHQGRGRERIRMAASQPQPDRLVPTHRATSEHTSLRQAMHSGPHKRVGPSFNGRPFTATKKIMPAGEAGSAALPSYPAPEAPLTQEEKLLARIARHPNPTSMALLNPEMRDQIAALDAENFQQFFKPSPAEEKINATQAAQVPSSN